MANSTAKFKSSGGNQASPIQLTVKWKYIRCVPLWTLLATSHIRMWMNLAHCFSFLTKL